MQSEYSFWQQAMGERPVCLCAEARSEVTALPSCAGHTLLHALGALLRARCGGASKVSTSGWSGQGIGFDTELQGQVLATCKVCIPPSALLTKSLNM